MKKRTLLLLIATFLSIPVILIIITTAWMTEGSIPSDDKSISRSDKLLVDARIILQKYPEGAYYVPEEEWPESMKALSPLSLLADQEGLYIKTREQFVDVWGIFIPRADSEKYLENKNMPSYNRVGNGIYRYYAG